MNKHSPNSAPGSYEPQTQPRFPAPSTRSSLTQWLVSRQRETQLRGGFDARAHRKLDNQSWESGGEKVNVPI
jgi:hypothetical protein